MPANASEPQLIFYRIFFPSILPLSFPSEILGLCQLTHRLYKVRIALQHHRSAQKFRSFLSPVVKYNKMWCRNPEQRASKWIFSVSPDPIKHGLRIVNQNPQIYVWAKLSHPSKIQKHPKYPFHGHSRCLTIPYDSSVPVTKFSCPDLIGSYLCHHLSTDCETALPPFGCVF